MRDLSNSEDWSIEEEGIQGYFHKMEEDFEKSSDLSLGKLDFVGRMLEGYWRMMGLQGDTKESCWDT